MPQSRFPAIVLLVACASGYLQPIAIRVHAADPVRPAAKSNSDKASDKAFKAVKKDFQQKAHSRKPADRAGALKLLADFPTGESAELVYVTLLDDSAAEVRKAAIEYLAAQRDNREVTDKLVQRMTTATRKGGLDVRALGSLL